MDSEMAQTQASQTRPSWPLELNLISHSLESFLLSPLSQDPHPQPRALTVLFWFWTLTSAPHLQLDFEPHPQSLTTSLCGGGSASSSPSRPPTLLRPSPLTSSPHLSLSISNPNISLTSSIGLWASPSVPHGLPLWLRVILILPLTPNTYLRGCASLCHHLSHFPHYKSYFFLFAYLLLEIVLLWPYNMNWCLKCFVS